MALTWLETCARTVYATGFRRIKPVRKEARQTKAKTAKRGWNVDLMIETEAADQCHVCKESRSYYSKASLKWEHGLPDVGGTDEHLSIISKGSATQ